MSAPDLSPAVRALEDAHANLRELYVAPDGLVWLITAAGAPKAEALEVSLRQLVGDLLPLLEPWRCAYCGGVAELPDGICAACHFGPERRHG